MIRAELYRITHTPSGKQYVGSTWSKLNDKTHLIRFEDHMTGNGGKWIQHLLNTGSTRNDFSIELLAVGSPEYVCDIEHKLAKDLLWPAGLNGNAGKNIIRTIEGQQKVSAAVSAAKKGKTKDLCEGVRVQSQKLAAMVGGNRTVKQKEWDAKKSALNKATGNRPPEPIPGSKMMNNGTQNKFVPPTEIQAYLDAGWKLGSCKSAWNKGKKIPNMKPRAIVACPYCSKAGNISQMKRWHYENCKHK